jgi:hypothetical protein
VLVRTFGKVIDNRSVGPLEKKEQLLLMKIYIQEVEDVSDKDCKDTGINILCHVHISWSHFLDNVYNTVK